jgi:serine/threonine protein phosphatase PrpC
MNYEYAALTDTGRTRVNNEDSVAVDPATGLAVLADGMGGYNAGEVASGMATSFITTELGRWLSQAEGRVLPRDIKRAMEICVENANTSIFNSACSNPDYSGMGTTLVVGAFLGPRLLLGHIGDSRCYRWRNHTLVQITRDHSLLQEQLDAGLITAEQAAVSPNRNLVTRALGVEASVMLEVNEFKVEAGDVYVMCSDGLSDMVSDAAIAAEFSRSHTLDALAENLIHLANDAGGRDNVSVLLVKASQSIKNRGLFDRLLGK